MSEKRGRVVAEGECWVTVRLPVDAQRQLDAIARRDERSVSWLVRKMVLAALERGELERVGADGRTGG